MSLLKKNEKDKLSAHLPRGRCTETERKIIEEKAKTSGVSLSKYVRDCCLDGFVAAKTPIADITLIKELRRMHANFNQYQKKLNSLHVDSPQDVKRVTSKIENVLDTLMGIESDTKN